MRVTTLQKPHWPQWRYYAQLPIYRAVALGCDIDPSQIKVEVEVRVPSEYRTRLAIACNHAKSGDLPVVTQHQQPYHREVRLTAFAAWVQEFIPDWSLPDEFPGKHQGAPEPAPAPSAKELSTKERTSLLVVIAALAKKAGVDYSQPTVAAKAIVEVAMGELGVRIGGRTVEEILKKIDEALDRKDP